MKYVIIILAMFIITPSHGHAAGSLGAGDKVPSQIRAVDHNGNGRSFDTLKGEEGLVLAFVRSVDWCPYCQAQVIDINSRLAEFQEAGYNVAVISYDPVAKTKPFADKHAIEFPLLSDPDSGIIKAFGILNTDQKPGSRFYGIPHPAIYVTDPEGTVTAVFTEEDYKERPRLDDVLAALN